MASVAAPTPTTPHFSTTVPAIPMRNTSEATSDAGIFLESFSVAALACAEIKLTIAGQMLSTSSTAALCTLRWHRSAPKPICRQWQPSPERSGAAWCGYRYIWPSPDRPSLKTRPCISESFEECPFRPACSRPRRSMTHRRCSPSWMGPECGRSQSRSTARQQSL